MGACAPDSGDPFPAGVGPVLSGRVAAGGDEDHEVAVRYRMLIDPERGELHPVAATLVVVGGRPIVGTDLHLSTGEPEHGPAAGRRAGRPSLAGTSKRTTGE